MAPEQIEGTADHRSDIYSLGLTLHELLTLQPAFDESQQGPLIRRKLHGGPPRPRSRNPAIPRDLETIVLKVSATAPDDRYRTAAELAEDLQRFLDDRPVAARRASWLEQLWRWSRRNPAIALSTALTLALLLTTAIVAIASNLAIRSALTAAEQARIESVASGELAEANLKLAIDAFESIFDNVASRGVPQSLVLEYEDENAPRFQSVLSDADAELLRQLLTFYERFARQNSPDIQLQAKTAVAYHRIGQIHQRLGHDRQADNAYADALAIYDQLLAEHPVNIEHRVAKARLLNDRGMLAGEPAGLSERNAEHHLQAVDVLSGLPGDIAAARVVRYELARSHDLAGSAFIRSLMTGLEGPQPREPGPSFPPRGGPKPKPKPEYGFGPRPGPGPSPPNEGPREFTERHLSLARQIVAGLLKESPDDPEYRLLLAQIERHRLVHLRLGGRAAETVEPFDAARTILSQLVADYPQTPQYRMELADTLSLASMWLPSLPDTDAENYLSMAIDACLQLVQAFPNVPQYQALLATSYRNLARIQKSRDDLKGAEQSLKLARERLNELLARNSAKEFHETTLIVVLRDLAEVKRSYGAHEQDDATLAESRDLLLDAITRLSDDSDGPEDPFRKGIRRSLYDGLARTLTLLGDTSGALEAAEQARRAGDLRSRPPLGPFHPEETAPRRVISPKTPPPGPAARNQDRDDG